MLKSNVSWSTNTDSYTQGKEAAKKAYTIVKQKRKVEKIKNDLETYIGKENFRSISSKMEEILNENRKI